MRLLLVGLVVLAARPLGAVAQRVVIGPEAIAGYAGRDAAALFGGLQVTTRLEWDGLSGSFAYRWIGVGRVCADGPETSCNVDTPNGHVFLLAVSRRLVGRSGPALHAGIEAGLGRFANNVGIGHETHPIAGTTVELLAPVGAFVLKFGGLGEWSSGTWFGGVTLGLGVRI